MEQFQRFEEDQQIQNYQQPVGFNPVRSTSEGGAIRQQYGQYQQSQQFYNQSTYFFIIKHGKRDIDTSNRF